MKVYFYIALIFAALLICPVAAEQNDSVPTLMPTTQAESAANITEIPSLPEPVTSNIPATVVPTDALTAAPTSVPTNAPTVVPTDMIAVALTTIALPPHEQDDGQGVSSDLANTGQTGLGQSPVDGQAPSNPQTDSVNSVDGVGTTSSSQWDKQSAFRCDRFLNGYAGFVTVGCRSHGTNGAVDYDTQGYWFLWENQLCLNKFGYYFPVYDVLKGECS